MIDAVLTHLSNDAIADKELGLVYKAQIQLDKLTIQVEGKKVRLSPGITVAAEIKTGKRRMIEYFLSPLLRYKQESIRERGIVSLSFSDKVISVPIERRDA